MVTYAQLSAMDTSRLSAAATAAGTLARSLTRRGDEVRSLAQWPNDMWSGRDSMAASFRLTIQSGPLYDASDAFKRGRSVLENLVDGVTAAKEHLRGAQNLLAGTGMTISPDGTVTTPVVDSAARAAHHAELARQAVAIIKEALRMAETADENATAALEGGTGGGHGGGGADTPSKFFKDRFHPSLSMDKDGNLGLGLGESKNDIGIEGPSLKSGPFSLNSGGVELNDDPWPGISLDRWPPKVSPPFGGVSVPNVSVDVGEVAERAKESGELLLNPPKLDRAVDTVKGALGFD